jgi:hypothetical protein
MPIPGPFSPAALSAGVVTNIASDILRHHTQALEGTLAGRMLKSAGLIEPDFDDRLRDTLSKALNLYFEIHPQYQLTGIIAFFRDPAVARQIGGYILDRRPIDHDQIQHALDRHLRSDGTTRVLMKQRGLEPARIVPDFLECYRRVLNEQLSVPQMAILLEIVDQTDTVIAEMRASEARLKAYMAQLMEKKLSSGALRPAYQTGQQELAADLIEEEEPILTHALKNQRPHVLVIGHVLDVDAECIGWDSPEPNVADYDVVIMDLTTAQNVQIPLPGASKQPRFQVDTSGYLQWPHIRRSIGRLLLSGGRLFVITDPRIVVHLDSPRAALHRAQNTSLLPFVPFGERVPSGRSKTWVDPRFEFYFREVEQWDFVLTGKVDEYFYEHFDEQVTCQVHPLANNRAGEIIALSISVWRDRSSTLGVIYILPPPTKITSGQAIELLIARLGNLREIPLGHAQEAQQIQEQVPASIERQTTAKKPSPARKLPPQEKPMAGIPLTLYNPLKQALLDCGPFESDDALRAIFVDDRLKPWRHSLPQASSPTSRAEAIIAFLVDKRRADTKESVLVLLLRVLSERHDPADECHLRLARLAEELEGTLGRGTSPAQRPTSIGGRTKAKPSSQSPQSDAQKAEPPRLEDSLTSGQLTAGGSYEQPQEAEKKDFFVSYNRADRQWAEWIAWQLEEAGYTTIIQAWDFRPGGNFVIEMQRAAEQARRTIAVLSPNYLQALYTQPEWAAAFAQDPTGEKGMLLPVRVQECELKGLLSQIVYIDLVGLGQEAAKQELIAGVKEDRAKPAIAPSFPGAVKHATSERPDFPGGASSD